MVTSTPATCPNCGAPASGNFCASCGTPLGARNCSACGSALTPGAKFCHRCGAPAGGGLRPAPVPFAAPQPDRTPWIIAGVLVVVTLAAVVYAASRRNAPQAPLMANAGNAGAAASGGSTLGPAPDISNMTPLEQFDRLDTRISEAMQRGDTNTVITFTPMALGAYANLPSTDRTIDVRYRTAILAAQVGMFAQARALADTIMTESPDNLLGYYVRAMVGTFSGDSAAAKAARSAFLAHYDQEIGKTRVEYAKNKDLLDQFRTVAQGK